MKRFTKVKFIGMSVCTTPAGLTSIEDTSDDGYYAGLINDTEDIEERVDVIKAFIESAYRAGRINESGETLKIFVLPEFFLRGVLGAYYNTWIYPVEYVLISKFNEALTKLKNDRVPIDDSCLFVLGTILSTHSPVNADSEPTKSLYDTGDNLLDVYYRLHPKCVSETNSVKTKVSMKDYLKILDGKDFSVDSGRFAAVNEASDNAYADVLVKTLNYCDTQADIEVSNRCLIISGAAKEAGKKLTEQTVKQPYGAWVVQKQFKSKEDFILNSKNNSQVCGAPKYIQTIVKYPDINNAAGEKKQCDEDGLSLFEYGGIKIGVDICLDHSKQRLVKHLFNHPDDYIDIQIIPSCGMSIRPQSVISRKGRYVFNCDGEYLLKDSSAGVDGIYSHTTLQRVDEKIEVKGKSVSKNAQLSPAYKASVKKSVIPKDKPLFRFSEYDIHIYETVSL